MLRFNVANLACSLAIVLATYSSHAQEISPADNGTSETAAPFLSASGLRLFTDLAENGFPLRLEYLGAIEELLSAELSTAGMPKDTETGPSTPTFRWDAWVERAQEQLERWGFIPDTLLRSRVSSLSLSLSHTLSVGPGWEWMGYVGGNEGGAHAGGEEQSSSEVEIRQLDTLNAKLDRLSSLQASGQLEEGFMDGVMSYLGAVGEGDLTGDLAPEQLTEVNRLIDEALSGQPGVESIDSTVHTPVRVQVGVADNGQPVYEEYEEQPSPLPAPAPTPVPNPGPMSRRTCGPLAGAALVYLAQARLFQAAGDKGPVGSGVVAALPVVRVPTPVYGLGHDPGSRSSMPTADVPTASSAFMAGQIENISVSFDTPGNAVHALITGIRVLHAELLALAAAQLHAANVRAGQAVLDIHGAYLPVTSDGGPDQYLAPEGYTSGAITPTGMGLHRLDSLPTVARAQAAAYQDGLFCAALLHLSRVGVQADAPLHGAVRPLFPTDAHAWSVLMRLAQGRMQAAMAVIGTRILSGRERAGEQTASPDGGSGLAERDGAVAAPLPTSPEALLALLEATSSRADLARGDPLAIAGVCTRALAFLMPLATETAGDSAQASKEAEDGPNSPFALPLWAAWEDGAALHGMDAAEADVNFWRAEAAGGDIEAVRQMGNLMVRGEGVQQDPDGAAQHLDRAARAGDVGAGVQLAILMLDTLPHTHVLHNASRAMELLRVGEKAHMPDAYSGLGYVYQTGVLPGHPVNMSAAIHYLTLAAVEGDNPSAHSNLAAMYLTAPKGGPGGDEGMAEDGEWGAVRYNGTLARWHLLEALRNGRSFAPAKFNLGLLLLHGMDQPDIELGAEGEGEGGGAGQEGAAHRKRPKGSCPLAMPHFASVALQASRWVSEVPLSPRLALEAYRTGADKVAGQNRAGGMLGFADGACKRAWAVASTLLGISGSNPASAQSSDGDALTPALLQYLALTVLGSGNAADNAGFLLENAGNISGSASLLGRGLAWDTVGLMHDAAGLADALFYRGAQLGGLANSIEAVDAATRVRILQCYEQVQQNQSGLESHKERVAACAQYSHALLDFRSVDSRFSTVMSVFNAHTAQQQQKQEQEAHDGNNVVETVHEGEAAVAPLSREGQPEAVDVHIHPARLASWVSYARAALGALGPALGPSRTQLVAPLSHALYSLGRCSSDGWEGVPACRLMQERKGVGVCPSPVAGAFFCFPEETGHWDEMEEGMRPRPSQVLHLEPDPEPQGVSLESNGTTGSVKGARGAAVNITVVPADSSEVGVYRGMRGWGGSPSVAALLRVQAGEERMNGQPLGRAWALMAEAAERGSGHAAFSLAMCAGTGSLGKLQTAHAAGEGGVSRPHTDIGLAWQLLDAALVADDMALWAVALGKAQLTGIWLGAALRGLWVSVPPNSDASAPTSASLWDALWDCAVNDGPAYVDEDSGKGVEAGVEPLTLHPPHDGDGTDRGVPDAEASSSGVTAADAESEAYARDAAEAERAHARWVHAQTRGPRVQVGPFPCSAYDRRLCTTLVRTALVVLLAVLLGLSSCAVVAVKGEGVPARARAAGQTAS